MKSDLGNGLDAGPTDGIEQILRDSSLHAELTDAVEQLCAVRATLDYELMQLVLACERSEVFAVDGSAALAEWLVLRMKVSRASATRCVEVAHALKQLPEIAAGFERGELSFEQVYELTRFVTPEEDREWAERARGLTVAQLRAWARTRRTITTEQAARDHDARSLTWRWDPGGRFMVLKGKLRADQGAVVQKALERLTEKMPKTPEGLYEPLRIRAADALVELASTRIAENSDGDRALVVVHVDAETLAGAEGAAVIEGGGATSPETARRLACDASVQVIPYQDGQPLGVGRRSRIPSAPLRRQVARRDQEMCRYPGCERRKHLKCHHVRHWTRDEGPT
ncbi:MAG: DUF222 domain-containing protein, partial [Actinomycetota bacterium]